MLLIYTANNSSRFSYIAEVLFSQAVNTPYNITTDKDDFIAWQGIKINYSPSAIIAQEIWIAPQGLLGEKGIKPQNIECFEWQGLQAFFKTGGNVGFDIFAAAFYLISRYEEYLPHEKDGYGRYAHTNSLAFKNGFLHLPLVNMWMKELEKIIQAKFPSFAFSYQSFSFTPTYDIDIAYAYKGKGFIRNAGGFCKELFTGKFTLLTERIKAISGSKDPFDTYAWLEALHRQYKVKPIYFFLLAERPKLYDKNLSPLNVAMQQLIKRIALKYETGIHPSWQSGDDERKLTTEIAALKKITGHVVTRSRQHYIRMALPHTYRLLIQNGIAEDYTMGYGSINGFRASIATPFYWYDLDKDVKTGLLVKPYCYMEANSFFEQHYNVQQAAEELLQYRNVVKAVNGQLITIFHNHFITTQPHWLPWRNMYAAFLQKQG